MKSLTERLRKDAQALPSISGDRRNGYMAVR
jgi:hypothetical protein